MLTVGGAGAPEGPPTVVIRLGGGLGNQLFQYAFGRRMALANDARLVLDAAGYRTIQRPDPMLGIRALGLEHFNIQATLATQPLPAWGSEAPLPERPWLKRKYVKWTRKLRAAWESRTPYFRRKLVREPQSRHFTFDPRVYNRAVRGTVVFEGYWQTEKYFLDVESLVRAELTVREPMDAENAHMADQIRSSPSISVHVRHGDNASGVETGMGILPRAFYEGAIREMRQIVHIPRFFVFSDDIGWAKDMLDLGEDAVFACHNPDSRNYDDLRLMSLCKHHICANSTFSWWGAWLGKKEGQVVYAPRRYWLNVDRSNPDLYPPSWRLI